MELFSVNMMAARKALLIHIEGSFPVVILMLSAFAFVDALQQPSYIYTSTSAAEIKPIGVTLGTEHHKQSHPDPSYTLKIKRKKLFPFPSLALRDKYLQYIIFLASHQIKMMTSLIKKAENFSSGLLSACLLVIHNSECCC